MNGDALLTGCPSSVADVRVQERSTASNAALPSTIEPAGRVWGEANGRGLTVSAKYVVHPERSEKNGVTTLPFSSEEAPDDAPS